MRFRGKIALVTGAASGIGLQIAMPGYCPYGSAKAAIATDSSTICNRHRGRFLSAI